MKVRRSQVSNLWRVSTCRSDKKMPLCKHGVVLKGVFGSPFSSNAGRGFLFKKINFRKLLQFEK